MKRRLSVSIFPMALLLLVSCGGGGSGGGSGAGSEVPVTLGQPGPGDPANNFPLEIGNFWHYTGTSTDPVSTPPYENAIVVLGSRSVGGFQYLDLRESNPAGEGQPDSYSLVKDQNGLAMVAAGPGSDPFFAQLVSYWEFRFGLAVGESFVQLDRTALDLGMDLDGDARNETVDVFSRVTNLGREVVAVPGGGSQEAVLFGRDMTINVRLSGSGQRLVSNSSEKAWFVANIGEVKSEITITANGTTETITEVLDAYRNGQSSYGVEVVGAVTEGFVSAGQTRIFAFPALTGQTALLSLAGLSGDADLSPYSGSCTSPARPGTTPEDCVYANPGGMVFAGVTGKENANFIIASGSVQIGGTPVNESASIPPDVPTAGQVATRGVSRYSTTGLVSGTHTVSIAGLTADADLHVYADDTYSMELDCTLRAVGDVVNNPESCTVSNVSALYFSVSSGELNRDGAWYTLIVH